MTEKDREIIAEWMELVNSVIHDLATDPLGRGTNQRRLKMNKLTAQFRDLEQSARPLDDGELGLHIDILQHFVDDTYQSRPEDEDIIFIRDELNEIKIQYVNLHNKLQIIR